MTGHLLANKEYTAQTTKSNRNNNADHSVLDKNSTSCKGIIIIHNDVGVFVPNGNAANAIRTDCYDIL